MSLESYLSNGWISRHEPSAREIDNLLKIADRDITQSQTDGLGPEWRFDIAYNASLQSATAALAAAGYRAERQSKHARTLESLAFTISLDSVTIDLLDRFRRKRHTAVYEQAGAVSEQEAKEMLQLAKRLRRQVVRWIRDQRPDLVP